MPKRTIREILDKFGNDYHYEFLLCRNIPGEKLIDQAEAQIKALVDSKIPEEKKHIKENHIGDVKSNCLTAGYNQAIDQTRKNMREI